jgi:hypothetical protein
MSSTSKIIADPLSDTGENAANYEEDQDMREDEELELEIDTSG